MERERLVHFDFLRILACFSVIMLHSAAQFWYELPVKSFDWIMINSYNATVRFGVPIFVMISGALFLSSEKEMDLKKLYFHNVLRLIILYLVWSAFYGLFDCRHYDWSTLKLNDIMIEVYAGRYHLWYLPAIVGIYMLVPVLKKWLKAASERDVQYFLLLFLIFQVGQNTVMSLKPSEWMKFLWGTVGLDGVFGYLGYFVLGYYLVHYGIEKKWHKWVYFGGILGVCANITFANYKSLQTGIPDGVIYDSFGCFTFLVVLALFLFFIDKMSKLKLTRRTTGIVKEISISTLGIYLMHLMWLEFLQEKGIHSMMVVPIIGVPLIAIICFLLCFLCATILRRLPFIGRYIC